MEKKRTYEIFMPPNVLKARLGGGKFLLDRGAVIRAEEIVEAMKTANSNWLNEEIEALATAFANLKKKPTLETIARLYRSSHDLRGQAVMFDFPLISRLAQLLCDLVETVADPEKMPIALMELHIDAIKVVLRDKAKAMDNQKALELVRELEHKDRTIRDAARRAKQS